MVLSEYNECVKSPTNIGFFNLSQKTLSKKIKKNKKVIDKD